MADGDDDAYDGFMRGLYDDDRDYNFRLQSVTRHHNYDEKISICHFFSFSGFEEIFAEFSEDVDLAVDSFRDHFGR